ncbi:MAG: hypothetical protein IJ147_03315 [Lachnospiraceae bacterium]|nr:hypothetical protein [Lachnospiraceae bacterium]
MGQNAAECGNLLQGTMELGENMLTEKPDSCNYLSVFYKYTYLCSCVVIILSEHQIDKGKAQGMVQKIAPKMMRML